MKEFGSIHVGDPDDPVGTRGGLGFLCLNARGLVWCFPRPDTDRIGRLAEQPSGQQSKKRQIEADGVQHDCFRWLGHERQPIESLKVEPLLEFPEPLPDKLQGPGVPPLTRWLPAGEVTGLRTIELPMEELRDRGLSILERTMANTGEFNGSIQAVALR